MRVSTVKIDQVCNLSRIPTSVTKNPVYMTALQIIDNSDIKFADTELFDHYKKYNPKTLYDMYGSVDKLKEYSYDQSFLPWIHKSPVVQFPDVAFITRENDFISRQVQKIKDIIHSIQEQGYCPENFPDRKGGHITGYWLSYNDCKKFYVVSGNHRVSICFAISSSREIPFLFEESHHFKSRDLINRRKNILDIYDTNDMSNWPSVTSGFLSENEAIEITKKYFGEKDE